MNALVTLHQPKMSDSPVTAALQNVLAETYGLYLATHNYHWNIEGENFLPLHAMFGEQYNALIEAVDNIAERIRALGDYALPFEGNNILEGLKLTSNALNKEAVASDRAKRMIHNLIELQDAVIESCNNAKAEARKNHDEESENLMVERITQHQKSNWMLHSIVKS